MTDIQKLGEKWIIEDMTIRITTDQLLKAILSISKIDLGEAEVYLEDIKSSGDVCFWDVKIKGAE